MCNEIWRLLSVVGRQQSDLVCGCCEKDDEKNRAGIKLIVMRGIAKNTIPSGVAYRQEILDESLLEMCIFKVDALIETECI